MNCVYKIVYLAKDGGTFHGLPYLYDESFLDIDNARKVQKELKKAGFKGVDIFKVPDVPDEITWGYVEDNKVE